MSTRPAGSPGGASSLSAMRLCAIDVGSNTVRLLVADVIGAGTWRIADQDQTITRLGENLARTGALGEAPMARTLAAVSGYVERGARLGASDIRIVATSAVREASNGRAFAVAVERATGRRVDVVSGEVEARLTLQGVRHGLGPLSGPVLTFDIGGGSTEYVLYEGDTDRPAIFLSRAPRGGAPSPRPRAARGDSLGPRRPPGRNRRDGDRPGGPRPRASPLRSEPRARARSEPRHGRRAS